MESKDNKRRIEILEQNPSLGDPFLDMVFGSHTKTNMEVLKGAVLGGIASAELLKELRLDVPICYKINGTVFLKGETTKVNEDHTLTELFDMTNEMKTGHSYSLYVGGLSYFAYADAGETEQVRNFLAKLAKT